MKVVLDCNVVVAAARTDGACREAIDRVMRNHELVLSAPILSEYETVAARPAQASCREALEVVIREIARVAVTVGPADLAFGLRDPDDEVYLATAAGRRRDPDHRQCAGLHGATLRVGRDMVAARVSRLHGLIGLRPVHHLTAR